MTRHTGSLGGVHGIVARDAGPRRSASAPLAGTAPASGHGPQGRRGLSVPEMSPSLFPLSCGTSDDAFLLRTDLRETLSF